MRERVDVESDGLTDMVADKHLDRQTDTLSDRRWEGGTDGKTECVAHQPSDVAGLFCFHSYIGNTSLRSACPVCIRAHECT